MPLANKLSHIGKDKLITNLTTLIKYFSDKSKLYSYFCAKYQYECSNLNGLSKEHIDELYKGIKSFPNETTLVRKVSNNYVKRLLKLSAKHLEKEKK